MTTEHAILFLDCSVLVTAALLIFVPGNAFRDKGPAGHDERIQRPPASWFRFARDGDTKITGLSGESGGWYRSRRRIVRAGRITISTPITRMAIRATR
jgi:hypothetical protein